MNYEMIKNYGRIIKLYFQFLCENGFSMKQYDNGVDYEVIYSRPECEIGVFCVFGLDNKLFASYKNKLMDDKQLMEDSHLDAHIVIKRKGSRNNLLKCDLFDALSLDDLKRNILNCRNDIDEILRTYSEFLKKNLNKLL